MSTAAPFMFPAPVGGFPISLDLGPSILFVCLYASLVGVAIYRIRKLHTRNVVMYMAAGYLTERTIVWTVRSWVSKTPSEAHNKHLVSYLQVGFIVGYLAIWGKLVFLLRATVINTTKGASFSESVDTPSTEELPRRSDVEVVTPGEGELSSKEKIGQTQDIVAVAQVSEKPQVEDQPHRRALYRKVFDIITPMMLLPFILGPIMGNWYPDAETDERKAQTVKIMRYLVAAIILMLIMTFQVMCVFALFMARNIRRGPTLLLLLLGCILMIIPIYQIVIMRNMTTSLLSRARGSQNTPEEKVFFYVLEVVPEFTCVCAILSINTKTIFGTGLWGDHEHHVLKIRKLFARRRTAA